MSFSSTYFEARDRFRSRARELGARVASLPLPAKGPGGESLTIDVACFGVDNPRNLLLHSSGLHGVEGFAGSAIQLDLLRDLPAFDKATGLAFVHVLNPFGMSWLRRVNGANVDLNRNYLHGEPYAGAPETYGRCDPFLNPKSPPSNDLFLLRTALLILRYGMPSLKQAVAGGQYAYPAGLFFGGKELQPELAMYREFLGSRFRGARKVVAIDIHTGLGKYAEDTLLVDARHFEPMRERFGIRVAPLDPERGPAYKVRGDFQKIVFDLFPSAEVSFVGQEFGTFSPIRNIRALREENRWHHYGRGSLDHPAKQALKETFCPDDEAWRRSVLARGRELVLHALAQLESETDAGFARAQGTRAGSAGT